MGIFVGRMQQPTPTVQQILPHIVARFLESHNKVIVMQLHFRVCSSVLNVNNKIHCAHHTLMEEDHQITKP